MKFFFTRPLAGCRAILAALAALASLAPGARAAALTDRANDLLSTYAGPANSGDLDVLSANVVFDGASFTFTTTVNGVIGTTPGGIYVFGLDRGTNNAPFGAFAPGVLFDAVLTARPDTTATVTNLGGGATFQLPTGSVLLSPDGRSLSVKVPASDFPSAGFAQSQYFYNLWPRNGTGNNNQISDFAPDDSDIIVTAVPEPGTTALLLLSTALTLAVWLRRRSGPAARRP